MKRILYYSIIMGIFTMLFGSCQASQKIETVDSATFKERISGASEVQLLDVRTAEEFAEGHLESAINIDVQGPSFTKKVSEQLDKSQPIYLYCRSGKRSMMAAKELEKEGYSIVNLKDGILGWLDAGYPVLK
ncbi:rhodanese [Porphyromonas sp. HMSC077F02]|uniref:rhodanese-like domain-containing protein n=1 Tax=Porphyromonas sp. HMSC077F02 TaxID=1739529 RepID=UPI0008A54423|nr:rhodanese-like domain-containing protein [Porphyromonas sp. HMSC077F02]OFO54200.1 rhodanese [Porphyromonas sp. HMSC077F02]